MDFEEFHLRKERWGCDLANLGCVFVFAAIFLPLAYVRESKFFWFLGGVCLILTVVHTVSLVAEWRYRRRLSKEFFHTVRISKSEIRFLSRDGHDVFSTQVSEIDDLIMVQSRNTNEMIIVCKDGNEFSIPVAVYQRLEHRRLLRKRLQELVGKKFHYVSVASRMR